MPASSKVKDTASKANTASESGDYDLALNLLRDAWNDDLKKDDQVLLIRTAGMTHMSRGQADESIRRQAWKDARKSLERAQKIDSANKETRRQLNSLMSMMDESGIYVGRGF
jgi:methionyl-tRNA synthetase